MGIRFSLIASQVPTKLKNQKMSNSIHNRSIQIHLINKWSTQLTEVTQVCHPSLVLMPVHSVEHHCMWHLRCWEIMSQVCSLTCGLWAVLYSRCTLEIHHFEETRILRLLVWSRKVSSTGLLQSTRIYKIWSLSSCKLIQQTDLELAKRVVAIHTMLSNNMTSSVSK